MGRKRIYLREKKALKRELRKRKKMVNIIKSRGWYSKIKYLSDSRVTLAKRRIKELEAEKKKRC